MKKRTGMVFRDSAGRWWARVTYLDPRTGKRREKRRRAVSKSGACDQREAILREVQRELTCHGVVGQVVTFRDLADFYLANYAIPAVFEGEQVVAGMRAYKSAVGLVNGALLPHFAAMPLDAISYETIVGFRTKRLATKTRRDGQRSVATVNREMATLRRMLNVARRARWIERNPFHDGESLISTAQETERSRILSDKEESTLLQVCAAKPTSKLSVIVLLALDTGLRKGEILRLEWSDVDIKARKIVVRASTTKTLRSRTVGLTDQLTAILKRWRTERPVGDPSVIGLTNNFKTTWQSALRDAKIEGLRFHDLRHTCGTRLAQAGLTIGEIARILGHTQIKTTYRYLASDEPTIARAAKVLTARRKKSSRQRAAR